jgi:hypothetical protein
MGMCAFNFEGLSVSIGKQQGGSDGLAGSVIQNAPFQPVYA